MQALVVVWADPGVTTGWSIHRVPIPMLMREGQVGSMSQVQWKTGQIRGGSTSANVDGYLELGRAAYERLADEDDIFVLGTEGFVLMMQSTDPDLLEPVRFNSVLEDRLRGTGQGVEVQLASPAMVTITDQRLKLWGAWKAGADHARDAQRHGLLFMRRFASDRRIQQRYGWSPQPA